MSWVWSCRTCPEITCNLLAITCWIDVIRTAGIVTLAHRGDVAAAIDIAHHMTTSHADAGIAIYLTGCDTVTPGTIGSAINSCFQRLDIFILTLATAIDRVTNQTTRHGDISITNDMTVFTAAID